MPENRMIDTLGTKIIINLGGYIHYFISRTAWLLYNELSNKDR